MKRSTRVMLVSPLPPPAGGIARWTSMIVQHAETRTGVTISVVNTAVRWRTLQQNSPGARILAGLPQTVSALSQLTSAAMRRKVDVVHINSSGHFSLLRDCVLAAAAALFRVPFVYHLRFGRVPEISDGATAEWKLLAWVARRAEAVISLDQKTHDVIGSLPPNAAHRIPNCVDLELASRARPAGHEGIGERYVLFVGWVIPAKGVEDLLAAWREIAPSGWKLVFVGGYDRAYLESIGHPPGNRSDIAFLGELPHPAVIQLMANCEIFVLPSHTEGFPNAILEAMSLGRAVVSTDVGAIGEILANDCGVVVRAQQQAGLRDALSGLMADEAARLELGRRARAKVETEYSLKAVFDKYLDVWNGAASAPKDERLDA